MGLSQRALMAIVSVLFLWGMLVLVGAPPSQALDTQNGFQIKNIFKSIFPPCGPGTRKDRFVVKGEKVCDNKTGLYWQKTPGSPEVQGNPCSNTVNCTWQEAIDYCEGLNDNGKHKKKPWRFPKLRELQSLVDYRVPPPGPVLPMDNPFMGVQVNPDNAYWTATDLAGDPDRAWRVRFFDGNVRNNNKETPNIDNFAWCVRGAMDAH